MNLGLYVNIFLTARILAILLVFVVRAAYISDIEVPGRILEIIWFGKTVKEKMIKTNLL